MATLSERIDDYCFFDFETRTRPGSGKDGDLPSAGAYRYALNARPIILTYAIGLQPVQCIDMFDPCNIPADLICFFERAEKGEAWFVAWNTGFDRAIWNHSFFALDLGLMEPEMALDAMAQAAASNLPAKLQDASLAVGGPGKRYGGKDLIKLFSAESGGTPATRPREWEEFKAYAVQDTDTLRDVFLRTRPLPPREWRDYWVSERINERGIGVDVGFCKRAHAVHLANIERVNARLQKITGLIEVRVTTVGQLADWVYERLDAGGRKIMDENQPDDEDGNKVDPKRRFDRQRIGKLLAYLRSLSPKNTDLIEVLELREYGGSSSPVKFDKIVAQETGNRLRGQYVFNGAMQTGRFSSKGVQIHNLPRASLEEHEEAAINLINAIELGEEE